MLTVDSIMRGPKLVGAPPSRRPLVRDSSKVYFTWQKASDERSATYVVNRDGTGLRALTPEESRALDVAARRAGLTARAAACSALKAATS